MPHNRQWVEFRSLAGSSAAEVYIMDFIGGWGYGAADFMQDLRALGDVSEIEVVISSNGGDPLVAFAVAELMRASRARVVTRVVGLAASAASIIAMAGDELVMGRDSFLMIHDAAADVSWGGPMSSDELRSAAEALDRIQGQIVAFYSRKTGMEPDQVRQMMADVSYLTAEEAVALKFADRIDDEPLRAVALDLSALPNVPVALAGLAARGDTAQPAKEHPMADDPNTAGADPADDNPPTTTVQAPDTATIEAAARQAGEADAMARVTEIMELCALAKQADKAPAFIAAGKTVAEVRKALVEAQASAEADQIDTRLPGVRNNGGAAQWADVYKPFRAANARPITNRM